MSATLLIGIDLGGTHIKGVLTNPRGDILDEKSTPTLDTPGQDNSTVWKASIKRMIEAFQAEQPTPIGAIGLSCPGIANAANTGIFALGGKLIGIDEFTWPEYLGQPAYVLNDAHAALFAESRIGAGQGIKDLLMITLGTGVGGGIMVNHQLLQGELGRAGHVGHISVRQDEHLDIVRTPGSLEDAIGQGTLEKRSYGRFQTTKALVEAHLAGDHFATWVWLSSVQALARGLASFINILSPELILIGGGIAQSHSALMDPLRAFLEIYEWRPKGFATPLEFAQLGNHAGAVGAALFAWEKRKQHG